MNASPPAQAGVISEVLRAAGKVALFFHVMPDGDAIGSALALWAGLRSLNKEARVFSSDQVPRAYRFLPFSRNVEKIGPDAVLTDRFDVAVFLDCTDPERSGNALQAIGSATAVVNVDHHVTNSMFGDHRWVDPGAAATGELVYWLLRELGVNLTPEIATCLYVAIISDTGRFTYSNTTPSSLRISAELIEAGVSPHSVAEELYETKSVAGTRLLAMALSTLELSEGGRVAWLQVTRDALRAAGASDEDTEGIVNFTRMIAGVEMGLLFREEAENRVRVAFRSRCRIDVSRLASRFGGGGHPRAAGCTLRGRLDEVKAAVLREALSMAGEMA